MPDPLDTYAARYAAMLDKMLGRPAETALRGPEPAACVVCREYAVSPLTGECFNCNRDPEDRAEP